MNSARGVAIFLLLLAWTYATIPPGHTLVWSDEFDNDATANVGNDFTLAGKFYAVDSCQACGSTNLYTSRSSNVRVSNGNLELTALRETYTNARLQKTEPFTSGAVQTYCGPTVGDWCRSGGIDNFSYDVKNMGSWSGNVSTYVEVKAKVPSGKLWPAIWLMPTGGAPWPKGGEIDIMESVDSAKREVHSTLHFGDTDHSCTGRYRIPQGQSDVSQAFHTYAVLWDNSNANRGLPVLRFFFDGNEITTNCQRWNPGTSMT